MASRVIYPPIVDSYMPAFTDDLNIYFNYSKFNSSADAPYAHVVITKHDTGMNVINPVDAGVTTITNLEGENESITRCRATGIILNAEIKYDKDKKLYYIPIYKTDILNEWTKGWIYKVQIRLSSVKCSSTGIQNQQVWLNHNASNFSEWSTVCIVKCTSKIDFTIPSLGFDSRVNTVYETIPEVNFTTFDVCGKFIRNDPSETIYKYNITLYTDSEIEEEILDSSGDIYANQYQDNDNFRYIMKTELKDGQTYHLSFKFETRNKYINGKYKYDKVEGIDDRLTFKCTLLGAKDSPCSIKTVESFTDLEQQALAEKGHTHPHINMTGSQFTSVYEEEEEGRIGLKFYTESHNKYSGNLCVRRCDSKDNFTIWTDMYVYVAKQEDINEIPIFYDYTIESGVWYKYGVQSIDTNGDRSKLSEMTIPVLRNFNYAYLLGKNNQQLKLKFDNTMDNFKYQLYDSATDTIGGKYPTVTRNGNVYYRTFPINGLISFNMDDNELFCTKLDIYHNRNIVNLFDGDKDHPEINPGYNYLHNINQYNDYIYERDFRNEVLKFLQDGELKLFKSTTEGNIIVRLTDVTCSPNQSLSRMIYSFSATAREMADNNLDNYLKYGFYSVDPYETDDFAIYETRIGQISTDIRLIGENKNNEIFQLIRDKYDGQGRNIGGFLKEVLNVHHIKITFDDRPLRIKNNSGGIVLGNNFQINDKVITVYNPVNMYEFDERLVYYPTIDKLYILGDTEGKQEYTHVTIDFLYECKTAIYVERQIARRAAVRKVGQLAGHYKPSTSLYGTVAYKYHLEEGYNFSKLMNISSIEINARPGATFKILSSGDVVGDIHIIGATGQLRFYELEGNIDGLIYLGITNSETGEIQEQSTDVILNYVATVLIGEYKRET